MLHVSLVPFFSYSLIHNLFQHAQNIVFSQVDVHVSLVIFSYSLIHDLFVWRGPANGLCHLWRAASF